MTSESTAERDEHLVAAGRLSVAANLSAPTSGTAPTCGTLFLVVRRSRDRKVKVTVGDIFASGRLSSQVSGHVIADASVCSPAPPSFFERTVCLM